MSTQNKHFLQILAVVLLLIFILTAPFMRILYSLGFAYIKNQEEKKMFIRKNEVFIDMKGGLETPFQKDWFPLVQIDYEGEKFGNFIGEEASLSLYYNYPTFRSSYGASAVFNEKSKFYNSFYGAAVIKNEERSPYIEGDGRNRMMNLEILSSYLYEQMFLRKLGFHYKDSVLQLDITSEEPDCFYSGKNGFTRAEGMLTVNGAAHEYKGFKTEYLRFGVPRSTETKDFSKVNLPFRIYYRYFDEWNVTVLFFIVARNMDVINECDDQILSKSRFTK